MGFSLGRSISFRSKLLSSSAGFTLEFLFANGKDGALFIVGNKPFEIDDLYSSSQDGALFSVEDTT
jgi:hypothetical protein